MSDSAKHSPVAGYNNIIQGRFIHGSQESRGTTSPITFTFCSGAVYPEFLSWTEEDDEEDPEEDPANYPADRGDDDDARMTEIPRLVYRFVKRGCVELLLVLECRGRESSAAGAARQFGPTTAEADLYGFTDMLEAAPGPARCLEKLAMRRRPRYAAAWGRSMDTCTSNIPEGMSQTTTGHGSQSEISELRQQTRGTDKISELLRADYRGRGS
ncbi:hypothetical protein Tco_0442071 [Tanacetum coccineum]